MSRPGEQSAKRSRRPVHRVVGNLGIGEHPNIDVRLSAMAVIGGVALFIVVSSVSTLAIDRWIRRRQRMTFLERLKPYRRISVADEAQRWLEEQS
jgi:hypothetical protein